MNSCNSPTTLTAFANGIYHNPFGFFFPPYYYYTCTGSKISDPEYMALATNSNLYTYQWSTGQNTQTINIQPGTTNYSVQVSNGCVTKTASINASNLTPFSNGLPQCNGNNTPCINWSTAMTANDPTKRFVVKEFPYVAYKTPAYNATTYKLQIFNRFGQMIYSIYQTARCDGFYNSEISWNGFMNYGSNAGSFFTGTSDAVVNFQLWLYRCSEGEGENPTGISDFFKGNITVVP